MYYAVDVLVYQKGAGNESNGWPQLLMVRRRLELRRLAFVLKAPRERALLIFFPHINLWASDDKKMTIFFKIRLCTLKYF